MKILVFSYDRAKFNRDSIVNNNIPVIAFHSTDPRYAVPTLFNGYDKSLTLFVDDVINGDQFAPDSGKRLVQFTKEHGAKVLEFINKHKDSEIFVIHGFAGICRSGAVGFFMNEKFNRNNVDDYSFFKVQNKQIQPNILILNTLTEMDKE